MRTGNVVTKVGQWQQRSLFSSYELAPYKKSRWRYIRQRLAREKQSADETRSLSAQLGADRGGSESEEWEPL